MGAVSVGLQIGFEQAEVVVFVMSQRALDTVMNEEVTLGGKAGLSALFVGKDAAALTVANSYFLRVDGGGIIVESNPKITKQY